ncbi:MAG TPA: TIGR00266 family protein [Terrimicrobiaceae bacterium]
MQTEILFRPSFSMTRVKLSPDEEIRVEGGAMVSMSEGITIKTKMQGGLLKSLTRSVFGGESFFINIYKGPADGGEINVASPLTGDMFVVELQDESMLVQSGSFVASATTVEVNTSWGGAKGFFGASDLILLKATGSGPLILGGYGAIQDVNLSPGQKYTIDTGHIIAFSEKLGFKVRKVGGLKSTLLSGEGLVVDLTGPGRALVQTRSPEAFLAWLIPLLPKPKDQPVAEQ